MKKHITKVVESKTFLEFFFFMKEELLNGLKPLDIKRSEVSYDDENKDLLDTKHYFYVFENGTAVTIRWDVWHCYSDLFEGARGLSSYKFYQYIIDNAENIDKLYKMKAFI